MQDWTRPRQKPAGERLFRAWPALLLIWSLGELPDAVTFHFGELLAAIAPRPTLLYTPKRDRDATFADVALCVDEVRPAWGAAGALRNPRPDDYSRLSPQAAAAVVEWAKAAVT